MCYQIALADWGQSSTFDLAFKFCIPVARAGRRERGLGQHERIRMIGRSQEQPSSQEPTRAARARTSPLKIPPRCENPRRFRVLRLQSRGVGAVRLNFKRARASTRELGAETSSLQAPPESSDVSRRDTERRWSYRVLVGVLYSEFYSRPKPVFVDLFWGGISTTAAGLLCPLRSAVGTVVREGSMAPSNNGRKNPLMHLVAGGVAGVVESSCCHPLDTIKTRMQLRIKGGSTKGPLRTASNIVSKEGFFALYKGLSAVMMGIVPKMAVRFTSFETYKDWLGASQTGNKGVCRLHPHM